MNYIRVTRPSRRVLLTASASALCAVVLWSLREESRLQPNCSRVNPFVTERRCGSPVLED
ncbi:hypothetical protein BV25DRAFT_1820113 [Artomyces pyxidatus]|uniref:Uncharacterized protein n=1 Tax=Artomyces pyxidatus TaxID=48021 RepID=A0ACB8TEZ0_9AGAM|nr:hypothetical protein BV25DRAFT_1820113 [Artomyces pyxidatus]